MSSKNVYTVYLYFLCCLLLACSTPSELSSLDHSANTSPKHLNFTQASQYLARVLTVPGQKVCFGNIEVEQDSQVPLASAILQELEMALAPRMLVVERQRLQELIQQHRLETSTLFNQNDIQRLGQFAQVQYIILGEIREQITEYEILLKLVDVQSAIIRRAGKAFLSKEYVPSQIVQEMSKIELASKGYPVNTPQPLLQYFTNAYMTHAGSAQNQGQPLEVKMQAQRKVEDKAVPLKNGDSLQSNDQYQLQIQLSKPAYLYAVSIRENGQVVPIAMNKNSPQQTYFLPGPDDKSWFTAQSQQGLGQVALLISMHPILELDKAETILPTEPSLSLHEPLIPNDMDFRKSKQANEQDNSAQSTWEFHRDVAFLSVWFQIASKKQ